MSYSWLKKISVFLIATVFSSCLFFTVRADTVGTLQKQMETIKEKIATLEKNSRLYQSTINKKRKEINSLQGRITLYNNKIEKLKNDLYLTNEQIKLKNLLVQSLNIEVNKTLFSIQKKKQILAGLIQVLNDYDQKSPIEALLGGEKLSDFLGKARDISLIYKNLHESLEQIKQLKLALEVKKEISEKQEQMLEELGRQTAIQEYALNQQRIQKQELLFRTKGEEARYQVLLHKVLTQKTELLKEMAQLEKEITRRKNFLFYTQAKTIPPPGTKLFRWPEDGAVLTQGYGMTPFARTGVYGGAGHNGIDMSAGIGSPIRAAADGEVLVSGFNNGWGNWVALKHPNGMVTLYAHILKPTFRTVGEKVKAGDVIGYEDSTGFVTGSHLHFSVYYKFFTYLRKGQLYFNYFDGTLNPLNYL